MTGKEATPATRRAQQRALHDVALEDQRLLDDPLHGLMAEFGDRVVRDSGGRTVWTLKGFEFLAAEEAPASVHPGLWQHARRNMANGLFKVRERLYQIRGLDISNMTLIEGDSGLIVIDPLMSVEVARAGLDLYFEHRPRRPVVAVIYTHSHADHFGGVRGVVDENDVRAGRVPVYAPAGFMEEALSENVTAGPAMLRRGHYQFGGLLPRGERGLVDAGLGKAASRGTSSLIPPTVSITEPHEMHRIDGVEIEFVLTPGAEAPAEMILFHPQLRALNMAELACHNQHNLLPIRGAQVRDALRWSKHIAHARRRYAERCDVLIGQHHWPVWGAERIADFLDRQRDLYRFIHDQTVRLMNHGRTAPDIAEQLRLPAGLSEDSSLHAFYGSLKHNIKAVYQRYLGWYDANPANLDPLPPRDEAIKLIEYMGGAGAALRRAQADFERGEYRWVARIASHLVCADPGDRAARALGADALEQLGYQSESATMRNAYLQGAAELREGPPRLPAAAGLRPDLIRAMPLEMYFDHLAVRLDGERAAGARIVLNWRFVDTGETVLLELSNAALHATVGATHPDAQASITLSRSLLDDIALQRTGFAEALEAGELSVDGSRDVFLAWVGMLDTFGGAFPIVEPCGSASS